MPPHVERPHPSPERQRAGVGTQALFFVRPEYAEFLRRHHLDSLVGLFEFSQGERLSKPGLDEWRQRWRLILPGGDKPCVLYLKRYTNPPRREGRRIRRSKGTAFSLAGHEWSWIQALTAAGIPCPLGVAFGEEMKRGREVRSAMLTAQVLGKSLESCVKQWDRADRPTVQTLIPTTAKLVAKLHAAGFIHRDLYLSHIFFDPSAPPDRSLCLIDLQRVLRPAWWFSRWVVKDLASMNYSTPDGLISRADRIRWLRYYLGVRRLGPVGKRLAYRVVGKTQRIAARDRRKARGPVGEPVPR